MNGELTSPGIHRFIIQGRQSDPWRQVASLGRSAVHCTKVVCLSCRASKWRERCAILFPGDDGFFHAPLVSAKKKDAQQMSLGLVFRLIFGIFLLFIYFFYFQLIRSTGNYYYYYYFFIPRKWRFRNRKNSNNHLRLMDFFFFLEFDALTKIDLYFFD